MGEVGAEEKKLIGGRYALDTLLGHGGMGEVWRAKHVALNSHVAIKFLSGASAQHPSTRKRFLTEAQVAAQLKTRHAVQVFDFGVSDEGQPYLVMELLDGETLGHRITRLSRLPVASTVRFLEQAARALDRAHALGIVHRDFKPDNIVVVLDEEGKEHVKVLDFGIAKLLNDLEVDAPDEGEGAMEHAKAFATFTRTGMILGTPLYMAPEQVRNSPDLDLRADIWAFGVVAFQCLTGLAPFEGKNLIDLFDRIQRGEYPPVRSLNPELPDAFEHWFKIACAPDPAKRFPSAKVAAAELALALDVVETRMSQPDLSGPSQGLTSSGERPVLGRSDSSGELAATMEAAAPSQRGGGVVSSSRFPAGGALAQNRLGRLPASRPPPPLPLQAAITTSPARPPSRGRSRALVAVALVAVPLLAVAVWRMNAPPAAPSSGSRAATATATGATSEIAAVAAQADPPLQRPAFAPPPVAPDATDRPASTASGAPSAASSVAIPRTRPTPTAPTTRPPPTPSVPGARVEPLPVTAATPTGSLLTPPPPAVTATTATSPFKLPPLGI